MSADGKPAEAAVILQFPQLVKCLECGGSGLTWNVQRRTKRQQVGSSCRSCGGKGRVRNLEAVVVEHCWQNCKNPECEECQRLVDDDILMACDHCGHVGYKEVSAAGNVRTDWNLCEDGSVLCGHCYEQNQNKS